ncbi:hypothetical protein AM1_0906 [Acaryochloris marina MBIC11017]|uniref:Uncharacterized protein n=1 Tax=Acaryochloris marina (strain MBIC 11017) TaxID=329726 RepID=B0BZM2_ACAM1|nr:hypothetical protein AM1_0906 [Acaryochloris marina MBIC11017]
MGMNLAHDWGNTDEVGLYSDIISTDDVKEINRSVWGEWVLW